MRARACRHARTRARACRHARRDRRYARKGRTSPPAQEPPEITRVIVHFIAPPSAAATAADPFPRPPPSATAPATAATATAAPPPVQARARAAGWCYPVGCQRCILEAGPARTHVIIITCSYPSRQRRARQARSTGTGPAPAAQGPSGTVSATYGLVLPREKTYTSPFWGAGGSACRAPMEEGMRGTSSALVIEQPLHM